MTTQVKILIIEDDMDLVAALKKLLENKGYQTKAAYSPKDGYDLLVKEKPDLIILDVMFGSQGESKGFDFATGLRTDKQYSDIPILMLTAINTLKPSFSFSPEKDGEYLPVDAFLDKPVNTEELFSKVEGLLQQKVSKWRHWPNKEE